MLFLFKTVIKTIFNTSTHCELRWCVYICMKSRGGAVAARLAHNQKDGGSNPPFATRRTPYFILNSLSPCSDARAF